MKNVFGILTALLMGTLLVSCSNDDDVLGSELFVEDINMETTVSALYEGVDDAVDFGDASDNGRAAGDHRFNDCVTVTHDEATGVTIIDFGEEGCVGRDGRLRIGKIIITKTGERRMVGWSRSLTFEDFSVDSIQIEGTRTITMIAGGGGEDFVFQTTLVAGKITFPDGTSVTRDASHIRTVSFDDEGEKNQATLSGSATGINKDALTYTNSIAESTPLLYTKNCRKEGVFAPVSGILTIDVEGESLLTIDFGDGTCDNLVIVTKDGVSTEIEVDPKQRRRVHKRMR